MSIETVRQFFAEHAPEVAIEELETSTATVQLATNPYTHSMKCCPRRDHRTARCV